MSLRALIHKEWMECFGTQIAWIHLCAFVFLAMLGTFQGAEWLPRSQADLVPFFDLHPWLHLLLASALAMRQWVEERRRGTLELLLTMPLRIRDLVLAKFLAAWFLVALALALTTPLWLTATWLGEPDHGVVIAGYVGSWLVAGVFLAIGNWASVVAGSQVAAFTITVVIGLLLLVAGLPALLEALGPWLPDALLGLVSALSVTRHFEPLVHGLLDLRDLAWFLVMISAWLALATLALRREREL